MLAGCIAVGESLAPTMRTIQFTDAEIRAFEEALLGPRGLDLVKHMRDLALGNPEPASRPELAARVREATGPCSWGVRV